MGQKMKIWIVMFFLFINLNAEELPLQLFEHGTNKNGTELRLKKTAINSLLNKKVRTISIPIHQIKSEDIVFSSIKQESSINGITWIGNDSSIGIQIAISISENELHAFVVGAFNAEFRKNDSGNYSIAVLTNHYKWACGNSVANPINKKTSTINGSISLERKMKTTTNDAEIDAVVFYTNDYANTYGGLTETRINTLISLANLAFINNDIKVGSEFLNLRAVHFRQVSYPDTSPICGSIIGLFGGAINDFYQNGSNFDNVDVEAIRDQFGADVAILVRNGVSTETDACGIARQIPTELDSDPRKAYMIVQDDGCEYCSPFTLAHELGHLLGCMHDSFHNPGDGWFSDSHGFYYLQGNTFPNFEFDYEINQVTQNGFADGFTTIMAYSREGENTTRIPYFSDPFVAPPYHGVSVGEANTANSRRAIINSNESIRSYRTQVLPGPTNHQPEISWVRYNSEIWEARETIVFSISAHDLDGDSLTVIWNFGDGTIVSKPYDSISQENNTVSHVFHEAGIYAISGSVHDGISSSQKTFTKTIIDRIIQVSVFGPGSVCTDSCNGGIQICNRDINHFDDCFGIDNIEFTVNPDLGNTIIDVIVNGVSIGTSPSYIFSDLNIAESYSIQAIFGSQTPNMPNILNGDLVLIVNSTGSYSTGGSQTSTGAPIEYQFDWGDGTSSGWNASGEQVHSWGSVGIFPTKARSRNANNTSLVSDWTGSLDITVTNPGTSFPAPTPESSWPSAGINNTSYEFCIVPYTHDGHDLKYLFKVDGNNATTWQSDPCLNYQFSSAGTHSISAQAKHSGLWGSDDFSELFATSFVVESAGDRYINWQFIPLNIGQTESEYMVYVYTFEGSTSAEGVPISMSANKGTFYGTIPTHTNNSGWERFYFRITEAEANSGDEIFTCTAWGEPFQRVTNLQVGTPPTIDPYNRLSINAAQALAVKSDLSEIVYSKSTDKRKVSRIGFPTGTSNTITVANGAIQHAEYNEAGTMVGVYSELGGATPHNMFVLASGTFNVISSFRTINGPDNDFGAFAWIGNELILPEEEEGSTNDVVREYTYSGSYRRSYTGWPLSDLGDGMAVAGSSVSNIIIAGDDDGRVGIYNYGSSSPIYFQTDYENDINDADINTAGNLAALGAQDSWLRIYDISGSFPSIIFQDDDRSNDSTGVAFITQEGEEKIASLSMTGILRVYHKNGTTWVLEFEKCLGNTGFGLSFANEKEVLAAAVDTSVYLFDFSSDTGPPVITVNVPGQIAPTTTQVSISGSCVDDIELHILDYQINGGSEVEITLNNGVFEFPVDITTPTTTLAFRAIDHIGKESTQTYTIEQVQENICTPDTPVSSSRLEVTIIGNIIVSGSTSNLGGAVEYRLNYGDGTISNWQLSTSFYYSWAIEGNYQIKAQARGLEYGTLSTWSTPFNIEILPPETVSTPSSPSGDAIGNTTVPLSFSTNGAVSNHGNAVEYQIDWGNSVQSNWSISGSFSQNWPIPGNYNIRARARSFSNHTVISAWSSSQAVEIGHSLQTIMIIGPETIDEESITVFSIQANFDDGTQTQPIPIWGENSNFATVDENGNVTTLDVAQDETFDLVASYEAFGIQKNNTRQITISNCRRIQVDSLPSQISSCIGSAQAFSVNVTQGAMPITYQWFHNSIAITGKTSSTMTINNLSQLDTGLYHCEMTNECGTISSSPTQLDLLEPVSFSTQPQSISQCPEEPVSFVVRADGEPPLTYQWQKDGSDLPGATGYQLELPSISLSDGGLYHCVVSNICGSVSSNLVTLIVDGTLRTEIHAPSIAQGLTPLTNGFDPFCAIGNLTWDWQDLNTMNVFGVNQNPVTIDDVPSITTLYKLSLLDDYDSELANAYFKVLVHSGSTDLNGDGENNYYDLWLALDQWPDGDMFFDADSDGTITTMDFQFIDTGNLSAPEAVALTVTPQIIQVGESSTLHWEWDYTDTVQIQGSPTTFVPIDNLIVSPQVTTNYGVKGIGPGGTRVEQIQVQVVPPTRISSFSATPSSIVNGESSTLSWTTMGGTSASISQGVGGVSLNGTIVVNPIQTTSYILTLSGPGGTVDETVTLTVHQSPQINSFTATPGTIISGASSTLVWTTTDATSVSIDNGLGNQTVDGSVSVSPTVTTTYHLTASGPGGTISQDVIVTVGNMPVINSFSASPNPIQQGETSTLTWSTTNTDTVSIDQGVGSQSVNGSVQVSPNQTTTYTLTSTNTHGSSNSTVTVMVIQPPVIDTFTVNPSTIQPGESATLAWTTTDATSVSIDQGIGSQAVDGSIQVSPTETTTYTLSATGPGGTVTSQQTVNVSSIPTTGLVAFWSFDEVTGTQLSDFSGNLHHGTLGSATAQGKFGAIGKAYGFDGTSASTVVIPSHSDFALSGHLAVSTWIFPLSFLGDGEAKLIIGQSAGNEFSLFLRNSTLEFFYEYGSDIDQILVVPLDAAFLGEWHHVLAQYNDVSQQQEIYIDGSLVASQAAEPPDLSEEPVGIGGPASLYDPRCFLGNIDSTRIYNRTLSSSEIQSLLDEGRIALGLRAYYPFNGNADDESGSGNDGIPNGGLSYSEGLNGPCASFDGVDDYVDLGNFPVPGKMSVSVWIKTSDINVEIFSKQKNPPTERGFIFFVHGSHVPSFASTTNETGQTVLFGTQSVTDNQWQHIVVTYDGAQIKMYQNSILVSSAPQTGDLINNDWDANIGIREQVSITGDYFKGLMDEMRIYRRALFPSEIEELYNELN